MNGVVREPFARPCVVAVHSGRLLRVALVGIEVGIGIGIGMVGRVRVLIWS